MRRRKRKERKAGKITLDWVPSGVREDIKYVEIENGKIEFN